ncbi:hypothetical protein [Amycolatopsis samaneae]|uniref:UDP-N-acetylglucosamine 2-epimerase domain-containing protein n=1 Tax=Amycolatopsis samaneae TaxID=664691 RepID=A0ABW5GY77_9PSEU
MIEQDKWLVPYGNGGGVGYTRAVDRVVLVVVHSVAAGQRLADAVSAVEEAASIQVVFTRPPGPHGDGVGDFLRSAAVLETSWQQAVRERFDLVVSASPTGIGVLDAPVLLLLGGTASGRLVDHQGRSGVAAIRRLLGRGGDPLLVGLPHRDDVEVVREDFPDIGRQAIVVGDPSFDRLVHMAGRREAVRAELGVQPHGRVGVVLSSRGPESLFGRSHDLLARIGRSRRGQADRLFCQLHPDVWVGHGRRQVLAWSAAARRAGLVIVPPWRDWLDALIAADYVVGDHGVVTCYAAALGKPVLLAHPADRWPTDAVLHGLPVLDPSKKLYAQLAAITGTRPRYHQITSAPHRSSALLRSAFRRLLKYQV